MSLDEYDPNARWNEESLMRRNLPRTMMMALALGAVVAMTGTSVLAQQSPGNMTPTPQFGAPTSTNQGAMTGSNQSGSTGAMVPVAPNNLDTWQPAMSGTAAIDFVPGPAQPPEGQGSALFVVGSNDSLAQLRNPLYQDRQLRDIATLRYSTYIQNGPQCNSGQQSGQQGVGPYLVLGIDNGRDGQVDEHLVFDPQQNGGFTCDRWQQWDAVTGRWYVAESGNSGQTLRLGDYLNNHSNATIVNAPNRLGGLRIGAGATQGRWEGFLGYVGSITVDFRGDTEGVTTFNFEKQAPSINPSNPFGNQGTSSSSSGSQNQGMNGYSTSTPVVGGPGMNSTATPTPASGTTGMSMSTTPTSILPFRGNQAAGSATPTPVPTNTAPGGNPGYGVGGL
jgi:hypothetical protein